MLSFISISGYIPAPAQCVIMCAGPVRRLADPGPRPARRPYAEKYAADQDLFFKEYTAAHLKLSELGVEWETEPFTFEDCLTCVGAKQ